MPEPEAAADDPLRTLRAERVERDDGRYIVYFSWPPADEEPAREPGEGGERQAAAERAGGKG